MFERYTERARRVIFFARFEASQYGSLAIETEHLLMGVMREGPDMLARFQPVASADDVRRRIEELAPPPRPRNLASIDLPLSDECKRSLAYAGEESERRGDRWIGTEHLLLGVLRDERCLASRVLGEFGLSLASVREQLSSQTGQVLTEYALPVPEPSSFPAADRPSLHALVDQLPENMLPRAKWMLEQLLGP